MLKYSNMSKADGRGCSEPEDDRVLVGRIDRREPGALQAHGTRADLRIAYAEKIPLDVVAGELAAGVELDALAQAQLDLTRVRADVPLLGEHRAGLLLQVVFRQAVVHVKERVVGGRAADVPVQAGDVVERPVAQAATAPGLSGRVCSRSRLAGGCWRAGRGGDDGRGGCSRRLRSSSRRRCLGRWCRSAAGREQRGAGACYEPAQDLASIECIEMTSDAGYRTTRHGICACSQHA